MGFHDVSLPPGIALGARGGPERLTEVVTLGSGHEERNTPWAASRRRWNVGYGLRSLNDVHALIGFFEARRGRLHGFRFRDGADWRSGPPLDPVTPFDQTIGTGDGAGTQFQLIKTYVSGSESETRIIRKPVGGTVAAAVDGVPLDTEDFTIDAATGMVTLTTPPSAGAVVTAGYEFDVPVRFDTDHLDINLAAFAAGETPNVPLIEIRLP
jgi:uncharacterized protein (TIGR02217 family)